MLAAMATSPAYAKIDASVFVREVTRGVDVVAAPRVAPDVIDDAPGALGAEVYETVDAVENIDMRIKRPR